MSDKEKTNRTAQMLLSDCVAFFKHKKSVGWLLIVGLVGIVLIGASSLFSSPAAQEKAQATKTDAASYAKELEERLSRMVSSVKGAGESEVMVTLENGVEYVYANEQKSNSDRSESESSGSVSSRDDTQQSVVVVDTGNGKEGLLVTEIQPTVRGVVVACEGGGDEAVVNAVKKAVTTALNITEKRVCVIQSTGKGDR
ncbi:MAG: hypothetical protein ACI39E_08385 [Acutalibacteraceae bacterium]